MLFEISLYFFLVTFVSILIFAFIYSWLDHYDLIDSLFYSVQIQTLSGIPNSFTPRSKYTKILIITQSLISYVLTTGIIIGTVLQPIHLKQLGLDFILT